MIRALVTGATGGIGGAIARQLASDGYHVILHSNSRPDKANKVIAELCRKGFSAEATSFDVSVHDQTISAIEKLLEKGPIQIVVNNAGIHDDMLMAGMEYETWSKVLNVSLDGFFNVTRPLLLPMMRTRWGRVINISSISGIIGNAGQTNYSAAKAGLNGATRALAREVASRGVTVNAIAPGIIDTDMSKEYFSDEDIKNMVPARRAGTSQDVANLVSFLASDRSDYISGQVIAVSGAMI